MILDFDPENLASESLRYVGGSETDGNSNGTQLPA
jgi:hypothetical protein